MARYFVLVVSVLVACGKSSGGEPPVGETAVPVVTPTAKVKEKPGPAALTPPPEEQPANKLKLGAAAPAFSLVDTEGKTHTLAQYRGKSVVLEWFNPDCPFVKYAHSKGELQEMAKQLGDEDLVWLSVNSNAPGKQGAGVERNREARDQYSINNPILLDESGTVGRSYGAEKTPHMFLIDAKGILVYRGGIDNAPMGEVDEARPRPQGVGPNQLVNYVKAALDDIEQGETIALPETPAYGCTVKYGS